MDFLPQELIRRKRDGESLSAAEIEFLVQGLTDGSLSEGQVAAFAMAVFFQGMGLDERVALTRGMARSGRVLDWRDAGLGRPIVDKHSTGGVGDKVSLMLAPVVAACGAAVPMISGRGLGHTGGTMDKMAAIPGYDPAPDAELFRRTVREVGCAIIGQTADMAPADRRLYAIRDVTATVESIPLITASILSKKLAAGLDALVMDVKFGSGAFMTDRAAASELARSIVGVATGAGLPTTAWLTDMNQVLGRTAGNAVEVLEAIDYLTGRARDPRLHQVVLALAIEMLRGVGIGTDRCGAQSLVEEALDSGRAAECFARMVATLGGPADLIDDPTRHLPAAPVSVAAAPAAPGLIQEIDVRQVGLAVVALGGGRTRADQAIDAAVGLTEIAGLGETVGPGRPLARIHARDAAAAHRAAAMLQAAFRIGDEVPAEMPVLAERL
jgi:thymidine phosphorylase